MFNTDQINNMFYLHNKMQTCRDASTTASGSAPQAVSHSYSLARVSIRFCGRRGTGAPTN